MMGWYNTILSDLLYINSHKAWNFSQAWASRQVLHENQQNMKQNNSYIMSA